MTRATATTRSHERGFWAVAFTFLALMAYSAVPTPLYAIYMARDGFGSLTVTVIFAVYAFGVMASLWLAGHLSDVLGRRRLLVAALVLTLLSSLFFLFWREVPGLMIGRFVNGLGIGAATATATAWIAELHTGARPEADARRAQRVALIANIGGLAVGPLAAGALAQWVDHPLTIPYLVSIATLVAGLVFVLLAPETRPAAVPRPAYRPQSVTIPAADRARFAAAALASLVAFAVYGLFNAMAPTFLAGTLHHTSHALAGAAAFVAFGSGVGAQLAAERLSVDRILRTGIGAMLAGLAILVLAVWLPTPSLALFLIGGAVAGGAGGLLFKGALTTVASIAPPETRAEALAGLFLCAYVGISVPVIGLGLMNEALSPRSALAIFAGVLAAGVLAATPVLLGGRKDAEQGANKVPVPV
ncbi:hypothetical protein DSM112329_05259 [Paraconexibacter sp. AEG42_29]|uniref:Major facilitator superfamily (MFS) profile domain-containing protein n=1 Tax=Paraconexibacter sp. AEG42_29 TaxID=2997339 RepID=A0AAU7B480_9ACTN